MKESKTNIDIIETRTEKNIIVLTILGVFLLIIDQYIFSALAFISVAYSCYLFLQNGLITIHFKNDKIQYKCMKNFRITCGQLLHSELNKNSLVLTKKITGLTSYEDLLLVKDKEILFKDSALAVCNLGEEKKAILIEKINFLIGNN